MTGRRWTGPDTLRLPPRRRPLGRALAALAAGSVALALCAHAPAAARDLIGVPIHGTAAAQILSLGFWMLGVGALLGALRARRRLLVQPGALRIRGRVIEISAADHPRIERRGDGVHLLLDSRNGDARRIPLGAWIDDLDAAEAVVRRLRGTEPPPGAGRIRAAAASPRPRRAAAAQPPAPATKAPSIAAETRAFAPRTVQAARDEAVQVFAASPLRRWYGAIATAALAALIGAQGLDQNAADDAEALARFAPWALGCAIILMWRAALTGRPRIEVSPARLRVFGAFGDSDYAMRDLGPPSGSPMISALVGRRFLRMPTRHELARAAARGRKPPRGAILIPLQGIVSDGETERRLRETIVAAQTQAQSRILIEALVDARRTGAPAPGLEPDTLRKGHRAAVRQRRRSARLLLLGAAVTLLGGALLGGG